MAVPVNFLNNFKAQVFNLFIPGKASKEIKQPQYGTDARTIEQWAATVIAAIRSSFLTIVAAINQSAIDYGDNWLVGAEPPAGTRFLDQSFVVAVTFTAGEGSIPVSGYNYGYNAVMCNAGSSAGSQIICQVREAAGTLTSLAVGAIETSGTPFTGDQVLSVRIVGA